MKPQIENLKILNGKEKKEILEMLNNQFGIKEVPGILLKRGKERIFLYEGNFDEESLRALEKITFIERVGVYWPFNISGSLFWSVSRIVNVKM